jgi:predicted porin
MHQFRSGGPIPGGADAIDLGADLRGLSVDAVYTQVRDAVSAASLTPAENAVSPGTLAATISDNTAYSLMAKYKRGRVRLYAGWEHIEYANPETPVAAGVTGLGGYVLSNVSNSAFDRHKILQIAWTGLRYNLTPRLTVTGAWYHYDQASFAATPCSNASAASCSGTMNQVSLVVDYHLQSRWDVYTGIGSSRVSGGLASGFLQTAVVSPMAGVRFNF